MPPFAILSAALGGIAVLVGYLALSIREPSAVVKRLTAAEAAFEQTLPRSFAEGLPERVAAMRQRAVEALGQLNKGAKVSGDLTRRLKWAGITLSPEVWVLLPYLLGTLGVVVGVSLGMLHPRYILPVTVVCAGLGALAPTLWLSQRLSARKARIASEILTYTEYLAMATQAGADFRTAVRQVAERFPGPVSEAFAQALLTSGIGGRMDDGLRAAQAELNNRDADAVVDALMKQQQWGSECAWMLLASTAAIRKERTERVMERASRSALLMLLPAVIFVLPVIFGLVLYPLLGQATHFLGP